MAKTLAGVVAVSALVLMMTGCGGDGGTRVVDLPTTTTAAKTVVNSYCGDWAEAARAGLLSSEEITRITSDQMLTGDISGVIVLVWTDGSISPTKNPCIFKDGLSLSERGLTFRDFSDLPK